MAAAAGVAASFVSAGAGVAGWNEMSTWVRWAFISARGSPDWIGERERDGSSALITERGVSGQKKNEEDAPLSPRASSRTTRRTSFRTEGFLSASSGPPLDRLSAVI